MPIRKTKTNKRSRPSKLDITFRDIKRASELARTMTSFLRILEASKNHKMLHRKQICIVAQLAVGSNRHTEYVSINLLDHPRALAQMTKILKPIAADAMIELKKLGIRHSQLTGGKKIPDEEDVD